jgi:hypothetical protein
MPSWKKVILSGSDAALNSLTVSNGITGSLFGTASYATVAANGGVTQLLAGPNITLSPTNGLGQVTISSLSGSGGGGFNTATGSYGSFYDTTTQTNPVGNIPRSMSLDTTDITNGVSVSGSTNPFNTYIKTENAGVYDIQFSAQVEKTDSGTDDIVIWLRKNGIDLTDTATRMTLTGNATKVVAAWNWFVNSAANDYYQIIWQSADTGMRLYAEPQDGTPGIPSVIVTVNRVDQFLSNTGSFSGSFTGQFTGSLFGTASFATSASFASTASFLNSTTNAFIQNGNSFGTQALLGTNDNQNLALETSGSIRMFISSSGNIGINKVNPNATLDVSGSAIISGSFTITPGTVRELQVRTTGVDIGNLITDTHTVTGSLSTSGSLTVNGNTIITGSTILNGLQTFQGTTASDTAPLGAELLTTGTGDASWTGVNFATGYTHVPGSITTLTSPLAGIVNTFYQMVYTITGRTAGSITIAFGGQSIAGVTATGAFGPRATTTDTLIITPTTDFNGTIVLSIKTIGTSSATTTLRDSTGVTTNEIRVSNITTNTFIGLNAGRRNTTGIVNSFFGQNAGSSNTTGVSNAFFGQSAGSSNTTGASNAFFGREAGFSNTTGTNNTSVGAAALFTNTTGASNTAIGVNALLSNTTANNNTAIGVNALSSNTTANNNTAIGLDALRFTTTGASNTAIGLSALRVNTTGANNTSVGAAALFTNTTGASNTAIGVNALFNLATGSSNTAIGFDAARRISNGTNLTTSNNSVFLGQDTRALADNQTNQIVIGHTAIGLGSNTVVLGNSSIVTTALRGSVGIGTTSPNATLDVNGSAIISGSLSQGNSNVATGTFSHAEGWETVALGTYQHVQGQFNISSSAQSAFIIGNGTSSGSRSNLVFASGSQFQVTGSLIVRDILQLAVRTTTPTPIEGMIIASGSAGSSVLYYYNGTSWNALF